MVQGWRALWAPSVWPHLTYEDRRLIVALASCFGAPSRGDMTGVNDGLAKLLLVQLHGPSLQAGTAQTSGRGRRITYS